MLEYIDIPKELLDEANRDPILAGYIKSRNKRIGIYYKDKVVGFFQPSQVEHNGKLYWRTNNIFVAKRYRQLGLGSQAIIDFFKDKEYGLAYIAFNNIPSLKSFEKAGFTLNFNVCRMNPKGVLFYLMLKEPKVVESAFTKWT